MHAFFTALPTLETPRLVLRALRLDDAADYWAYARDPAVAEPGMWLPLPLLEANVQDLAATLARPRHGAWRTAPLAG